MKIKQLLGNRILATRVKRERAPGSKIIMPAIVQDDDNTGGPKEWEVLQVGPGRLARNGTPVPIECAPGDRIICHSWATGAVDAGEGRFILDADMIMAVIPVER